MRRTIFLLISIISLSLVDAYAQRYLPKMQGVELKGGFVDGLNAPIDFYTSVGLSNYTKHQNRWVFAAEYIQKSYDYKSVQIPRSQFTVEGGYYYMFLSDPSKTIFFSIGTSALLGYETVNWGKKLLYDGATLRSEDSFIYGGAITFEVETYLSDKIVLLVNIRERIIFGSSIGNFNTLFGVGLKFIIN